MLCIIVSVQCDLLLEDEGEEGITMALIKTEDKLTTRNTSNVKIENNKLKNTNLIMTDKEESTTVEGELMTNNFEIGRA